MPTHLNGTDTTGVTPTAAAESVTLPSDYAADLADLLGRLGEWIDTEHDQLDPLLAKHDYAIIGLRVALDLHASLLRGSDDRNHDQPPL